MRLAIEITISAAAFLVATIALYASNLKRADIRLSSLGTKQPRLIAQAWSIPEPKNLAINGQIFAYNSGARGGILLEIDQVVINGHHGFLSLGAITVSSRESTGALPYAMKSGDVQLFHFSVPVIPDVRVSPDAGERVKDLATKFAQVDALEISIAYRFIKGYSLMPGRRGAPLAKNRTLTEKVEIHALISELARHLDSA